MTRTSHVATARTARSRRWHPIALLAGAVHRSARWNRAVSRRAMLGFVMTLALAVAAVGLTGTGTAGAQTQTAGAADGAGFTCVTSGGLIIGQGLPCDYGTSPPPLLNELALQSGTYAATPAQQASLSNVEQQAVANTISDHKLSASDTTAVQTWGRDDAEGELWALIVRAVSAVHAGTATPDQTNVDNWFTEVVRRQNVEAADDAGLEYAKWAGLGAASYQNLLATNPSKATLQSFLQGTPLNYTSAEGYRTPASADGEGYCLYQSPAGAPDGYTANIYTPITQSTAPQNCFTPDYSITGPIVPTPTLQQFQEWGGTDASRPFTSASFVLTSRDIAEGIGFGSSVIGAGAIAAGTSLALTPILTSVATSSGVSALAAFSSASGPLAALGGAELAGAVGGVAAASIAAIPAIALVALAVGVIYAINVFQDNALPGQLATLVTEAPTTTPDVYAMLGTPAQSSGAYGLFVGATLPDPLAHSCDNSFLVQSATNPNPAPCLNGPPLPVQNASDPTFLVSEKGVSGATAAPTINWQDSSAGTTNSAWLAGNWFVNTETAKSDGSTLTLPRLEIHYTDWNGDEQTAWLVGDAGAGYQFVTFDDTTAGADSSADVLAPSTCATKGICDSAPSIQYLGTDGKDHAATVVAGSAPVDPTPTVSVTTSATKVTVSGSPLTYTAHASSPAGLPLHYSWCVMHGSTNCDFAGTDPTLTFTPTFAGPLYAYLTVTDSQQHYAVASDVSLSVVDPSSTSLQVSPSSPAAGAPVTLTATVSDQAATNKFSYGYVDFFSGGALVCSNVRLTPTVPPGPNTATCTTTFQAAGPHPVLAYYAGGYLGGGQLILASSATATVDVAGPPSAPAGLVSSAGNGQVHLSWSAPADNGSPITGYRVYQGTDTGGESAIPAATVDGTTTSAVVSGLTNGTRYYFTVEAVNANGSSLPSSEATATPATVPDVPTGLLATAGQPGSGKLTLSWTAPANDGGSPLLGYQVFQAASPGAEATTPVAALTGTSTTITGLSDYTAYYFTVKAINAVGTGAVSGEASTTLGVPPSVTTTSLPAATVGTPYNATLSATGGLAPYTWSVTAGALPAGLTLNPTTGAVSGTPSAAGTSSFTVTAKSANPGLNTASAHLGITVAKGASTTKLSASTDSPSFGQALTFAATVAPAPSSSGGPVPTGNVTFSLDGQQVGPSVALNSGTARSSAVTNLAPGSHHVTATYSGGADYTGSTTGLDETVTCSQTITSGSGSPQVTGSTCVEGGTVNGPITVAPGGTLALIGATVQGPITTSGAASVLVCGTSVSGPVNLTGSTGPVALGGPAGSSCAADHITGSVTARQAKGTLRLDNGVVTGPVSFTGDTGGVAVEGTTVGGALTVTQDSGGVSVSDDTVYGPLRVTGNTGPVMVDSNTVSGPVTVSQNSSPSAPTVSANTVGGPLVCSGNTPPPTDAGKVNQVSGPATGQCAGLG